MSSEQEQIDRAFREIHEVKADAMDVRNEINEVKLDVMGVRGEIKEIRTALIGLDGQNGLRGELRAFMKTIAEKDSKLEKLIVQQEENLNKRMDSQDAVLNTLSQEVSLSSQNHIDLETKFNHYLEVDRPNTCIGKADVDKFKKELQERSTKKDKDDKAMKRVVLAMVGTILVSVITSTASIINTALNRQESESSKSVQQSATVRK